MLRCHDGEADRGHDHRSPIDRKSTLQDLTTAKALGLEVPASVLARADEVIE
jgi:hypothetical protein